jgi:membrane-bound lytic murein transglycosylase B
MIAQPSHLAACLLLAAALASCSATANAPPPVGAAPSAPPSAPPGAKDLAEARPDFATWLAGLRGEALGRGIRPQTLDAALAGVAPIPRVIELDRRQPEFTLTFDDYIGRVVPPARVERGRQQLDENRALLDQVSRRYGVQSRFVVALWGIESDFGRITGSFKIVPALATLAYDGRRSSYFRRELLDALRILDDGHATPDTMIGSWAGAMGQSQFMPSSFLRFAVDFDGDGRRDIWQTRADVLASAANYLAQSGWKGDETWGRAVRLPPGFDAALADQKVEKTLSQWQALGVRRSDGGDLPTRPVMASLVLPAGPEGPAFLAYNNYKVILKWNRSHFFAIAAGTLADRIEGR